ncbi:hypothetical protein B0H13DRAFT_2003435, partial [Mycena leptocephala]
HWPIGYCAAGRNTNPTLEALQERQLAVEICNAENRAPLPDGTPCPLPAVPGLPRSDSCTPCPAHATCSQFHLEACDTGFLLKSHPLLFFSPAPAGSRTLRSVWLLPRCVVDPQTKLKIGALGRRMENELGCNAWAAQENMLANFQREYEEAIQQLSDRKRYIALKAPYFSWDCAISVKVRKWEQWQRNVFWLVALFLSAVFARCRGLRKRPTSPLRNSET